MAAEWVWVVSWGRLAADKQLNMLNVITRNSNAM